MEWNCEILQDITPAIEKWWDTLCGRIRTLQNQGRPGGLYLIAISRKMPRIFDWIENTWIPGISDRKSREDKQSMMETIRRIGLSSEHAIPVILADTDPDNPNKDIIVIDDIIITGNTMEDVTADIFAYSGIKPYISTIFISESAQKEFPNGIFIDSVAVMEVPNDEIRPLVGVICDLIKSSSLPMELEFPIFHLDEPYDKLSEALRQEADAIGYQHYDIEHRSSDGKISRNRSVILRHELRWTLNHDYARIRLFEKKTGAILEVSAPRVVPKYETDSENLFKETSYSQAWKYVFNVIGRWKDRTDGKRINLTVSERVLRRSAMTLAVWANYLYSFAVGMNTCKVTPLLKDFPLDPEVKEKDIILLVGKDNACGLTDILNRIAKSRTVEPWTVEKYYSTPMYLVPPAIEDEYDDARSDSALNYKSIREALRNLWESHQNPARLRIGHTKQNIRLMSRIGETISSIEKLYDYAYREDEDRFVCDLNRELDRGVDEGEVSPFYATVEEGSSGQLCWRRFYRGGSSSII